MTANQRGLHRHEVSAAIDVWDALSDEHLGRLVNIHQQGLMVLSDWPLSEDHLYQLRINLPQSLSSSGEMTVGVDCLWVRSSADGERHWAGCQIIDLSEKGRGQVDMLVEKLGVGGAQ